MLLTMLWKQMVAKLFWRGKFIHTYKETEEYLFFLPGSLLKGCLTSAGVWHWPLSPQHLLMHIKDKQCLTEEANSREWLLLLLLPQLQLAALVPTSGTTSKPLSSCMRVAPVHQFSAARVLDTKLASWTKYVCFWGRKWGMGTCREEFWDNFCIAAIYKTYTGQMCFLKA